VTPTWVETFEREVARVREEAVGLEQALTRVVALAREMLAAAGEQMAAALASRDVIGQAKGILMERRKIGPEDAFRILQQASQRGNVKVRDLAEQLAASVLEGGPPRPDV
jgi:AmiR/NasT family two-component response regulator